MLICEYVIAYEHKSTGYQIWTSKKKSDGRTNEMIRQQEQLSGSLITINFTKVYRFFHFEKSVLEGVFAHITRNSHYH